MEFRLHQKQWEAYQALTMPDSTATSVCVVAGRRGGKTLLACTALIQGAKVNTQGVGFYVAPTQQQARDIAWETFQDILRGSGAVFNSHESSIKIPGHRPIYLKGSDRPDTMRGVKLFGAVLDEFADMKEEVHESIIAPALMDLNGFLLVIGTPKGKNHFHSLAEASKVDPTWAYFHWTTYENPHIPKENIDKLALTMSSYNFEQEIMAKFKKSESDLFKASWIKTYKESDLPKQGRWYAAADLAGFTDYEKQMAKKKPNLDETAVASVFVDDKGVWYVDDITHGRYSVAGTASKVLETVRTKGCQTVGVEKGILFQSIYPVLLQTMNTTGHRARIQELTHGNTNKTQRITDALAARLEHGKIFFKDGARFLNKFQDQLFDIPSTKNHDDLPDALAMISQMVPRHGGGVSSKDFVTNYLDGVKLSTDN